MRLLCDANISQRVIIHLRANDHDVASVSEQDPNADDEIILAQALRENRILITYDKDFGQLVFEREINHCGVILIRTHDETYSMYIKVLDHFIITHDEREIRAHFWTLTDSDVREAKSTN